MDNTENLIDLCKKGNRKAQYEIYKHYSKAMFSVCFRILNHQQDAEDALQEAFLKAFTNIDFFRNESTFGAWLKRIVINTAVNVVRKKKIVWQEITSQTEHYEEEPTSEHEQDWQIEQVRNGIQQLPNGFRVVLSLYLLEGYDHQEISEILDISVSTSKSQYNRAKRSLLEILKN